MGSGRTEEWKRRKVKEVRKEERSLRRKKRRKKGEGK